jgi:hypothetical protein
VVKPSSGISETWKTSSASDGDGCVEVRRTTAGVQVRDSKNPGGTVLDFTDWEWNVFLVGVALGEFSLPESTAGCTM